jgi:hypothetical protein
MPDSTTPKLPLADATLNPKRGGPPQSRPATVGEHGWPDSAYCVHLPSYIRVEVGLHDLPDLRVQAQRGFPAANLGGVELPTKILYLALKETSRLCPRHRRFMYKATAIYLTDLSTTLNDDPQGILGGTARVHRRLLIRQEALGLLQLSDEQLQLLVNTRQVTVIRIAGEERFDSRDLEQLIESYKTTASRRAQ